MGLLRSPQRRGWRSQEECMQMALEVFPMGTPNNYLQYHAGLVLLGLTCAGLGRFLPSITPSPAHARIFASPDARLPPGVVNVLYAPTSNSHSPGGTTQFPSRALTPSPLTCDISQPVTLESPVGFYPCNSPPNTPTQSIVQCLSSGRCHLFGVFSHTTHTHAYSALPL